MLSVAILIVSRQMIMNKQLSARDVDVNTQEVRMSLIELNQQLIDEEVENIKAEVTKDVQKEFNKMIKSIFK